MTKQLAKIAAILMLTSIMGAAVAGPVTIPNQFSSGAPARASEVNANFNAVAQSVNGNASDISTLNQTVSNHTGSINTLNQTVTGHSSSISGHTSSISTLNQSVSGHTTSINGLSQTAGNHENRIDALEQGGSSTPPVTFTVSSLDPQPGDTVTVLGDVFTIYQIEVVRFDTDEIYLLRFPSKSATSARVNSRGIYPGVSPSAVAAAHTQIDSFDVYVNDFFDTSYTLTKQSSDRKVEVRHSPFLSISFANFGTETSLGLGWSHEDLSSVTAPPSSYDGSNVIDPFTAIARRSGRDAIKNQMRELLRYVRLIKKV